MKKTTEFWLEHVAAIKQEGISTNAYARRHGIAVKRLYYWQRKMKAASLPLQARPPNAFVALRVAESAIVKRSAHCTLLLGAGLRLEMDALPAPEWLAALSRATTGAH